MQKTGKRQGYNGLDLAPTGKDKNKHGIQTGRRNRRDKRRKSGARPEEFKAETAAQAEKGEKPLSPGFPVTGLMVLQRFLRLTRDALQPTIFFPSREHFFSGMCQAGVNPGGPPQKYLGTPSKTKKFLKNFFTIHSKPVILNSMNIVIITAVFAASLALILGIALGVFRKVFHVETDVLVGLIRETLPGANCGACGFPGCDGFASAVASRTAPPDKCTVSSADETKKRGSLLGVDASSVPKVAFLICQGSVDCAQPKGVYTGTQSCRGAKISAGGTKLCSWGCLGFGDCVNVCPFGAISIGANGLPQIDNSLCTGCGKCSTECPQLVLKQIPREQKGAIALCANRSTIKPSVRKACAVGCIKCESCIKKCPAEALKLEGGVPAIDYGKCTSCGICLTSCPSKVFTILGEIAKTADTPAA